MKIHQLKKLIIEVIKEYGEHRFGTSGEWLEPDGTVHDVERKIHFAWAEKYLKNKEIQTDDPMKYLYDRGWVRVIYSANEYLIMITKQGRLTKYQLGYLEDQSEETSWIVVDDEGRRIYTPIDCNTPDEILNQFNENIDSIYHNQVGNSSQCSGYSHDVTIPDVTQMVRDPLNDPQLNGKMNEESGQYKFNDFKWLSNGDGFGIPTDVYHGSILLGVIVSYPDGYMISLIKGPKGDVGIGPSAKNKFKTKDDAAEMLHRVWKSYRQGEETKIW